MQTTRAHLVLILTLTAPALQTASAFTLVKQGEPAAQVIVPENADKVEMAGANDLIEFVGKMSDAKLTLVKAGEELDASKGQIRVGKALAEPVKEVLDKVANYPSGYIIAVRGNTLFLAGPPTTLDEEKAFDSYLKASTQAELAGERDAFAGRRGALLYAVSAADGAKLAERKLASMPIFDGMAAARGRLYLSTTDGRVLCLGAE